MQVHEFVSASDLHILRAYINPIQAMGGGDGAEDVAGGLQVKWSAIGHTAACLPSTKAPSCSQH